MHVSLTEGAELQASNGRVRELLTRNNLLPTRDLVEVGISDTQISISGFIFFLGTFRQLYQHFITTAGHLHLSTATLFSAAQDLNLLLHTERSEDEAIKKSYKDQRGREPTCISIKQ